VLPSNDMPIKLCFGAGGANIAGEMKTHVFSTAFCSSFHCLKPFANVFRTTMSRPTVSNAVCSHSGHNGLNSTPAARVCHHHEQDEADDSTVLDDVQMTSVLAHGDPIEACRCLLESADVLWKMRTDTDTEQHRRHELERNVSVEQRRGRAGGARLEQPVDDAAHSAAGDHRVTQPRALLQVWIATYDVCQHRCWMRSLERRRQVLDSGDGAHRSQASC